VDKSRYKLFRDVPLPKPGDVRFKDPVKDLAYMQRAFLKVLPPSTLYPDFETDKALIDMCALDHGVFLLKRVDESSDGEPAHMEVDMMFMKNFKVREGFCPYGGKAIFDLDMTEIISIQNPEEKKAVMRPKSNASQNKVDAWEVAKVRFLSSLITVFTAREHLLEVHFKVANSLAIACREHLSYENPLRALLEPFHFGTPKINSGALKMLFPDNGIFERTFPLDKGEFPKLAQAVYDAFIPRSPRHYISENGLDHLSNLPIAMEGVEYWDACVRFAAAYLTTFMAAKSEEESVDDDDLTHAHITPASFGAWEEEIAAWQEAINGFLNMGPDDPSHGKFTLIEVISFCMYSVSAQHQAVGAIGFDTLWMCPSCTIPGKNRLESLPPKNILYMAFLLSALTSSKMPMLSEDTLYDIWPAAEVHEAVHRFKADVREISENTATNNKTRSRVISSFDPLTFECSVSV